ncbi:hypothetical protein ASPZODRAFT_169869 [Penicilliopsis zonata CBS 506.65]|uniref:Uncharacterized protein n=1 Tax=Penicilliopsis zonata CBS 506.65 TaxID=1073090 RepID=A0A1L9S6K5_9EURO|nr:hypothetical protein ASPZODRAFT_169869 [Penicilliopsis zonata CBS 506.65]OJJ42811.1 hypothetical protein ASPZODRAFT_169869 [Penicilliopsis zonata CBS 506.65]
MLGDFPPELLIQISHHLPPPSLLSLLRTNSTIYALLLPELYRCNISSTGGHALSFYAFYGYESHVRAMLVRGAQVDIPNPRYRDYTPLMLAVSRGHLGIVRVLVEYGAEINGRGERHVPLELAVLNPVEGLEMLTLLLDLGAKVDARGENGRTALTTAGLSQSPFTAEMVALLLHGGRDRS